MRALGQIPFLLSGVLSSAILVEPSTAIAGMPSVQFTDVAAMRLQTISFFAVGLFLSAAIIQGLWNWLRADFTRLPRLSYPKACGLVVLWGLLFVLVLTMISGARELLTPGAWKKNGLTYSLAEPDPTEQVDNELRNDQNRQLQRLADLLAVYAANNAGGYPESVEAANFPESFWLVPPRGELRFRYVKGLKTTDSEIPLAYVPLSDGHAVPVLLASGQITLLSLDEVTQRLSGRQP